MIHVFSLTLIRRLQTDDWGFELTTKDYGVFVSRIKPNSPAERAGALKKGDRILTVNGANLASDSRAWFVDLNCRFGVECRLLVERDPEALIAEKSIARAFSTESNNAFEQSENERRNELVEILHIETDGNLDSPGEDPYISKFLKRMRLGMPLPGEVPNFEISENVRSDLTLLVDRAERKRSYELQPERVLQFDKDSRFSDCQLLKMMGTNRIVAPDDYVPNFLAITREEFHKSEIRKQRERSEFKKQGLVLTRREREKLPSLDAPDETTPNSILDVDPTVRTMFEWMGRGMYNDFA